MFNYFVLVTICGVAKSYRVVRAPLGQGAYSSERQYRDRHGQWIGPTCNGDDCYPPSVAYTKAKQYKTHETASRAMRLVALNERPTR